MAIPKFEDFLYPFLYRLKDMDNVSIKDMKKSIIGETYSRIQTSIDECVACDYPL